MTVYLVGEPGLAPLVVCGTHTLALKAARSWFPITTKNWPDEKLNKFIEARQVMEEKWSLLSRRKNK